MHLRLQIFLAVWAMFVFNTIAHAQLPVEVFAGHEKTTVDIMFFKFIKNKQGQASRFLFFNRNRSSIDYEMTETTNLPQFGFTEALSYNHSSLKGLAPVMVASILNRGVFPKAGIQYARVKNEYTIFSWVVTELTSDHNIDFFLLARYTPTLSGQWHLFTQMELVNTLPTQENNNFAFTQRWRLGLKHHSFQFGFGMDFSQLGRDMYTKTNNKGVFLRYEF